jgi:starch synthase
MPHIVSAHSLEPMRPWKAEQLGGGYAVSSWVEKTAYDAADGVIAVSAAMRDDVLRSYPSVDPARVHVVHNGIDTTEWAPVPNPDRVRELGVDPDRPSVIFVGRITRQKGLPLFLRAAAALPPEVQLVLCAGAPDTPEIEAEVRGLVEDLAATRSGVVWIAEMLPRPDVVALLTAATVFACPSIYEPLGIVNLEAMACETAVVATATGGIPEVVVDGETGWLVPIEQATDGTGTPLDPERYVADLAAALTDAVSDPDRAQAYGVAGRRRAEESFSWDAIAARTVELYRSLT